MTDALLRLEGVFKRYGAFAVTDGVELSVAGGELHALIGPNGAGKTTLVHQITGTVPPDKGRILFNGEDITHLPAHERVRKGVARSYQVTNVYLHCTVRDNLALAVQAGTPRPLHPWSVALRQSDFHERALAVLGRVGLADKAQILAKNLSHGEQRRLEVGLALATSPRLLVLDEPLAGMGPEDSEQMVALIGQLKQQCTVLMIEHDMAAVFRLADRISVLVSGRVIETATPAEVRASVAVKQAYLGDEAGGRA